MTKNSLGERCKQLELLEAGRIAMPGLPVLARLDGRAFHTFTRDLERPFDPGMSRCMIETARFLVQETVANVGYTQSDEITLAWLDGVPFEGRYQKLTSVLAGMASARFCQLVVEQLPAKAHETPHFDCRVWQVPSAMDALEVFIWREDDATKNSIAMAATAYYNNTDLQGKDIATQQDMLIAKGINWNDYPAFFKRGTYLQRRDISQTLSEETKQRIPEAHRAAAEAAYVRRRVIELDLPPLRRIGNLAAVLFEAAEPLPRIHAS